MGKLLLQLGNSQNWEQVYNRTWSAQIVPGGKQFVPISKQTLPILADRRILVAGTTSIDAQPNWQTGGWLTPKLYVQGLTLPFIEANVNSFRLPLSDYRLMILPDLSHSYRLEFRVPKWLKSVELDIWQYIGDEKDSTDELIKQIAPQWGYFT